MTNEDIIRSPVFRALNHLIDRKVEEMRVDMTLFKERASGKSAYEWKPKVSTRISHEENRKDCDVEVPMHVREMTDLRSLIDECERLETEINELQRFKLRLLNDWDFTHGDATEQIAIFGEVTTD